MNDMVADGLNSYPDKEFTDECQTIINHLLTALWSEWHCGVQAYVHTALAGMDATERPAFRRVDFAGFGVGEAVSIVYRMDVNADAVARAVVDMLIRSCLNKAELAFYAQERLEDE